MFKGTYGRMLQMTDENQPPPGFGGPSVKKATNGTNSNRNENQYIETGRNPSLESFSLMFGNELNS